MRKKTVTACGLACLCLALSVARAATAEDRIDALADKLLDAAGVRSGVCCVVRCGSGELAATLARRSNLIVLAVDDREAQIAQAREVARKTGLLGTRLFVDAGTLSKLPLTTDFADLVVCADLDHAVFDDAKAAELRRVLAPGLGQAWLGQAAAAENAGTPARQQLEQWTKQADASFQIAEHAGGLWAVYKKPAKTGADNWSYWNHGADNNPVSDDTAYGAPESLQWLARPFQTGMSVLYLAAGGRVFLAFSGDRFSGSAGWPRYGPEDAIETKERHIHALNGYNGQLLWSRPLPVTPWLSYYAFGYSIWVANPDRFYYGETHDVVTLDSANGKELSRFPAASGDQWIIWMAVQDGRAYLLTGSRHKDSVHAGRRLAAYDLNTKALVWEHHEATPIDAHAVGINKGRLCFYAGEKRAAALDLEHGKELWSNENLDPPGTKPVLWNALAAHLVCNADTVKILSVTRGMLVLSARDGSLVWRKPRGLARSLGNVALAELSGRLLTNGLPGLHGLDLQNGHNLERESFGFSGCGRIIGTPRYSIGQLGTVYDLEKKQTVTRQYMKPACAVGNIVAHGLRYGAPHWCRCLQAFRGLLAWNHLPGEQPPRRDFPLDEAAAGAVPELQLDAADWPQHRRDPQHSGASPASVGRTQPREKWRYVPEIPAQPTPPSVAYDAVFTGGSDGYVRCLDAKTGRLRWDYPTAGKIYFPPTCADSRVFAGSSDGRAYCLSAAQGKMQWRFRGAPNDRRMLVYGELISRWPINSNLVVERGSVYMTAGLVDTSGVYVHAVDVRTGALKWTNDTLGSQDKKGTGATPLGAMAVAGGRLWLRCDAGHPSFDLETGALPAPGQPGMGEPPPSREREGMGRDFGIFSGKYLIDGGRRLYSDQCDRAQTRCDAFAQELGPDGGPLYPRYQLAHRGKPMLLMPVWDDGLFVSISGRTLTAVHSEKLLKAFADTKTMDKGVIAVSQQPPRELWSSPCPHVNALVLCRDAVLTAEGVAQEINPGLSTHKTRITQWRLVARNREDGGELWSLVLPGEPVFDGMAVDRHGGIVIACVDGTIVCLARE